MPELKEKDNYLVSLGQSSPKFVYTDSLEKAYSLLKFLLENNFKALHKERDYDSNVEFNERDEVDYIEPLKVSIERLSDTPYSNQQEAVIALKSLIKLKKIGFKVKKSESTKVEEKES